MKTPEHFLEELKCFITGRIEWEIKVHEGRRDEACQAYKDVLKKIEQFEAEQKQVKDENK